MESGLLDLLKVPLKARNQVVDALFYDVSLLTPQDYAALSPLSDRKGAIIVVSPGQGIRQFPNALQFMSAQGVSDECKVKAIVVAGVGSSVLGTAALARQVANHYQCEVAGIVSGYGMADIVLEGLGGWFFYGEIDRMRYQVQQSTQSIKDMLPWVFTGKDGTDELVALFTSPLDRYVPSNPDVAALHEVLFMRYLFRKPQELVLLVGHSKGNLLICSVLNNMFSELKSKTWKSVREEGPFDNLAVVTFGAVVDLPDGLIRPENQHQFLGTLDVLGKMNSVTFYGTSKLHTDVPGAGHHLSKFPGAMPVDELLKGVKLLKPPPQERFNGMKLRPRANQLPAEVRGLS